MINHPQHPGVQQYGQQAQIFNNNKKKKVPRIVTFNTK
jgi:hypothetical protein